MVMAQLSSQKDKGCVYRQASADCSFGYRLVDRSRTKPIFAGFRLFQMFFKSGEDPFSRYLSIHIFECSLPIILQQIIVCNAFAIKNTMETPHHNNPNATPAITLTPAVLTFPSFKVGRLYTHLLQLSNISPHPILISIVPTRTSRLYFQVQAITQAAYKPVPPGDTIQYNVIFTAQLNQDLKEELEVYVKRVVEGRPAVFLQKVLYDIQCKRNTVSFRCSTNLIDFGKVILKERNCMTLQFYSEGVESVQLTLETEQGIPISQSSKLPPSLLSCLSQLQLQPSYQTRGQLLQIPIHYLPKQPGLLNLTLHLVIKNFLQFPPIKLKLIGECIELPVVCEKGLYDMGICVVGHIYKEKLVFWNRSGSSMKIQIQQPSETRKHFEFNPVLGFIQKHSKIQVWVKFTVERDTVGQLAKYFTKGQGGYQVPFKLMAVAQEAPVEFKISFKITTDRLTITPQIIDFGKIYSGTASKYQFSLKNQSMLEQQVMLLSQSKHIFVDQIQPIRILPQQTIKCRLIFKSDKICNAPSLNQESAIKCLVITGNVSTHQLKLNTLCTVICPSLNVSHNKIHLPVVQIQQTFSTTVSLRNDSSLPLIFQLFLPYFELCGLHITPVVRTLSPKQSVELTIEYWSFIKSFNINMLRMLEEKYAQLTASREIVKLEESRKKRNLSAVAESSSGEMTLEELERLGGRYVELENGEYYVWLIPIYFKQKDFPDASAEVTYLEISTISIQKTLLIDQKIVQFGQIAVGSSSIKQIDITNLDPATEVRKSQMHTFSGFEVINSLKRMEMNETFTIRVQFKPLEEIDFQQKLTLYTERSMVSCVLKGRGVRPQISVEPDNGLLGMGNLMPGERSRKTFTIHNLAKFKVKFKLSIKSQGVLNYDKRSAFILIPDSGYIQPQSPLQIQIQFNPRRPSPNFFNLICIQVQEQKSQKRVYVFGRCYRQRIFVREYVKECMPAQGPSKKAEYVYDIVEQEGAKARVVEFGKEQNEKKMVIGCCGKNEGGETKEYQYWVEVQEEEDRAMALSCEQKQGTFVIGEEKILTFRIEEKDDAMPKISILEGISELKQFKVTITVRQISQISSFQAHEQTFQVTFKAYQKQI